MAERAPATEEAPPAPDPGPLVACAAVFPWFVASTWLPDPWKGASMALLVLLALLLVLACSWSHRAAQARGLDAARWSVRTALTMGLAMLVLVYHPEPTLRGPAYLCHACARIGDLGEPFCFGCGASA